MTATLKKHSDGTDVAGTLYTTAKGTAGVSGGGLNAARLYVYGPRTAPKPVLTPGAAVTPIATQATNLFLSTTDANVQTSTSGFKYKLQPIPVGMKGTFMVRFDAADYGRISDKNFISTSDAYLTIQIGTATVDKKIAGDCTKCHGTGTAPFHDARHAVVFNTDECISCHDLSGNHADPLANRVHAVHSSSVTGDLMGVDWSEVAYPVGTKNGGVQKCAVCHDSGNAQYQSNVASFTCRGCHADNVGALDHMLQNGGN